MKTKRIIETGVVAASLLLLLVIGLCFFGPKNQTEYEIPDGTYRMETEENSEFVPYIHFYMEGDTVRFVFGADPRMSFAYAGEAELDGKLTAHADNGGETWIFEVISKDTIAFVQEGSSRFLGEEIPDGTVFRFMNN